MYISYSGFATFEACRKAFYLEYIVKAPLKVPENRVNMIFGDAVGKIFERFYRDEIWRSNTSARLQALVQPTIERIIAKEVSKGGVVDWADPSLAAGCRSVEEVSAEVRATIPRALGSIRQHWLLGVDAQAELVLDVDVGDHRIAGRADFVMTRARTNDLVLVDGKGSRYRDAYTDHRQLRWYAMLHNLKFGRAPDRLGFLYWRSPPAESMDWSVVSNEALGVLRDMIVETLTGIEQDRARVEAGEQAFSVFFPNPGSGCKFCKYRHQCSEGQKVVSDSYKAERERIRLLGVEEGGIGL